MLADLRLVETRPPSVARDICDLLDWLQIMRASRGMVTWALRAESHPRRRMDLRHKLDRIETLCAQTRTAIAALKRRGMR